MKNKNLIKDNICLDDTNLGKIKNIIKLKPKADSEKIKRLEELVNILFEKISELEFKIKNLSQK